MGAGLISQIVPGELVIAAYHSGKAFAQNFVKFKAWDFAITGASGPNILLGDTVAFGQIFIGNNAGTGEAVDIFFRSGALLGIVQRGVDFLRPIDQVAQFGRVH